MKLNELNMDWSDRTRDHFDEYLAAYKEHAKNVDNYRRWPIWAKH